MVSQNIVSVKGLSEMIPAFTESMIRWWIFNADINGLNKSLIKIGGRVYIDLASFNEWLEGQRVG
ncbi:MAG: DNA-binding protein [Pseudomonadota bacterium]|nr:DNA-binding protein [Pseudomonadota bacterium]